MDNTVKKEKGFLSKVWSAHATATKYLGLFGLPLTLGFLPMAAFNASAANPNATIMDTFVMLFSMMGKTVAESFVPGWSVIGGQLADVATGAASLVLNTTPDIAP